MKQRPSQKKKRVKRMNRKNNISKRDTEGAIQLWGPIQNRVDAATRELWGNLEPRDILDALAVFAIESPSALLRSVTTPQRPS